jgi:lysophospholipase L1-like esterase
MQNDKINTTNKTAARQRIGLHIYWWLLLLSLPYIVWESYWAGHVGSHFVKWHTHLAFYFFLWLLPCLLLDMADQIFRRKPNLKLHIIWASVCGSLILLESILICTGTTATYFERLGTGYQSVYSINEKSYYSTYPPGTSLHIDRIDFVHTRLTNSLGYCDGEWPIKKHMGEKRILCLGDSWTEGVGARYDSSYVSILRSMLCSRDTNYTVMNAAISGDDPCVNYINYRDRLAVYNPDVIIQTLSSNDMNTDIAVKGGLERFNGDTTLKQPPAPWWEPIYALSNVSRLIFRALGYNELLLRVPFSKAKTDELNQKAIEAFSLYAALAKKNGALLIVVLQADRKNREYDLSPIVTYLHTQKNVRVYDLLPTYIDTFDRPGTNTAAYYWPHDGHHTPKGYALMARGIYQALDSFYIRPMADRDTSEARIK